MTTNYPEMFHVTNIWEDHSEINWTIEAFPHLHYNVIGPQFSAPPICEMQFKATLEFKRIPRNRRGIGEMINVGLINVSASKCPVKVHFQLLNSSGFIFNKDSFESCFSSSDKCLSKDMVRPGLFGNGKLSFDDKLIIRGFISVQKCTEKKELKKDSTLNNISQLQKEFKDQLKNSQFTDVVFNIGNDVIGAHKFVLCARSSIFRKMFECDMKESSCNSVNITDMDKSVFETFLIFLYSGIVEDSTLNTVVALYSAADKYEVKTLLETCRGILLPYISEKTVTVILKLADLHNDDILKETAVDFICNNFVKVEITSEWMQLLDTDPQLGSFVLRLVSTSISDKLH